MRILRYDSYQLISNDGEIIHEGFRPYMNKNRKIEWVSILKGLAQETTFNALFSLLEIPS